ncbi:MULTISPECIES: LysR family transcriptional regulator [unclassified Sphingobium]|uniref:LysR family transcriptional regulator n=1 Tax=unclassified Sphingobium TaxID=2611147 RepID=UPI002225AEFF|nr:MULTISPECIES: LysR family transcriptional regulator [unclassified Sphingobium]MCW2351580.1 DNA-binding transcriptional LysR family regulator [Sphingobium sp. B12D2B]MCW2370846.1 DNA-binding transcriptional LysR family regulator [Sphingobium sp. B11D3D]
MEYGKLRNFDLNLLVVLGAVLEHQSVSAAADELSMSQSSASHALTRLRRLLGDELFVKTRNRMMPTPKALELAGPINEILQSAGNILLSTASFQPELAERTLHLALGDVGEIMLMPTLLEFVRNTAPSCKIQTVMSLAHEAEQELLDGKLDLYVGFIASPSLDLMCQKLYDDDMVVICATDYPYDGVMTMADYAAADHVIHQIRSAAKTRVDHMLDSRGLRRNSRIITPNASATPFIVSNDKTLIALYPRSLATFMKKIHDIKILELDFDTGTIEVLQYWHRRYNNDPLVSWLRKSMFGMFNDATKNRGG